MRKNFEGTYNVLRDVGVSDPQKLTLFEFNSAIEFHEKKKST